MLGRYLWKVLEVRMLTQYLTTACNISFLSTTNERERERERERENHTVVVYPRKHSLNVMH
jgi:hypothetical protein